MQNILLIGNGAREHVIAEVLKRNECKLFSYLASNNPGIISLSEDYIIGNLTNLEKITEFALKHNINFAIIGPEAPLENGIVDKLKENNIQSIGPTQSLARLETSKSFTRNLLFKYNIKGNPKFKTFTSLEGIEKFMNELNGNYVVKADGLCGGKGVKLSGEHLLNIKEGLNFCNESIEKFGKVVVEEKFIGEEFSLMSFVDGETIIDFPTVQDHKRAFENDVGPNTGGMGSYSDKNYLPFLDQNSLDEAHKITEQTMHALFKETNEKYKGIMYGGFIRTQTGVKLIEYNARFGDPEVLNVLPLLNTNFVEICQAIINGTLNTFNISFLNKATVCKYVVPEGYPINAVKGEKISFENDKNISIYYASINKVNEDLIMLGSRALAFVSQADSIIEAENNVENAISKVKGRVFHRKDIGTKELIQKKLNRMNLILQNEKST